MESQIFIALKRMELVQEKLRYIFWMVQIIIKIIYSKGATTLAQTDNNWQFCLGDFNHDGYPNL